MKKLLALALTLTLACAGCAWAEEPTGAETTETETTEEGSTLYDPISITLWANPSAGYEWSCEYETNGVLAAPMQDFVEDAHAEGEVGTGGNYQFYFGVLEPGRAQIIFNYGPSWGVTAPEETVICTVIVEEDGKSQVRWTQVYQSDRTLMVRLPANPTTGLDWNYEEDTSGMVTLTKQDYAAISEDLAGAGGNTTYLFHIETPGETVLMFDYANMWDPYATAEETYAVTVVVNTDMEISIGVE